MRVYTTMSKLDDAIAAAKKQMEAQNISCNEDLLKSIAKGLGPSIYNPDGKLVAAGEAHLTAKNYALYSATFW